jgi:microsomal dipeptidase-like Zn-dependent dipeptidase
MIQRALGTVAVVVTVATIGTFAFGPGIVEDRINRVAPHAPYEPSAAIRAKHAALVIADLHADTLLWARDPLARAGRGHVDLPRLGEGNVALQVFSVVTQVPAGLNYEANTGDSDRVALLAILQRWPVASWNDLFERARVQAERLHDAERRAPDALRVIESAEDLRQTLAERRAGSRIVGGLLATEGSHTLRGNVKNVKALYDAGFRMMGLHHFFDNELGGSLHGVGKGGLTNHGRAVVREMVNQGVIIDVAHSSPAVVDEVLAMTRAPLVVSHTGVKGNCDTPRNLEDAQMRRIADGGGLIGIGYWEGAVCDTSPAGVVAAIRYAVDLVGASHVALGSDYDGATHVRFDTSELAVLTGAMSEAGFSDEEIRKVMGGNAMEFFLARLPQSS